MAKDKEYWRNYYAKNPHIKEQKRLATQRRRATLKAKCSQLELPLIPTRPTSPKYFTNVSNLAIVLLVGLLTFQLLYDMKDAYGSGWMGWLKAASLEGLIIAFSALAGRASKLLVIGVCLLSLYAMSSKELDELRVAYQHNQELETVISRLEASLSRRNALSSELMTKGKLTLASQLETKADEHLTWLETLKSKRIQPRLHVTLVNILCRVCLLFGNVLLIQKLKVYS